MPFRASAVGVSWTLDVRGQRASGPVATGGAGVASRVKGGVPREEVVTVFDEVHGVAVIAVSELERARGFYEGVLGFAPEEIQEEAESVVYRVGGTPLLMYRSGYAGTAQNTVFAVETADLAGDMAALRDKGVEFKDYDFPGLTTVDGVAEMPGEKSAWFEDTEGNILALTQRT